MTHLESNWLYKVKEQNLQESHSTADSEGMQQHQVEQVAIETQSLIIGLQLPKVDGA